MSNKGVFEYNFFSAVLYVILSPSLVILNEVKNLEPFATLEGRALRPKNLTPP